MELETREYPLAYAPIPKGIVKDEPAEVPNLEEDQEECGPFMAYRPLPHGFIKEELQLEGGNDNSNSGIQQTKQQEGKEDQLNGATDAASIIVPFVDTLASGNRNDIGKPRANKQKKTRKDRRSSETMPSSSRILRYQSKGSSTKELSMVERDTGAKKQQYDERSEHSSLDVVSSTDEEDSDPEETLAACRTKKAVSKRSVEVSHSEDKPMFKCKECGQAFKLEMHLKRHLARTCRIEPRFLCKECDHQFKRKDHLKQHLLKTHNIEKSQFASFGAGPKIRPAFPFKCNKCDKTYKQKSSLTQHLKFGCDLDPSFPCTLCDYRAPQKSTLRRHLMTVHSVARSQLNAFGAAATVVRPLQPFKCENCGRTYKRKNGLSQHLKYECGVDPSFYCTQCDYRAKQKRNLESHIINIHAVAGHSQLEI